jgi:RNA polymerase sigma-70 factor (ECF subfamily)
VDPRAICAARDGDAAALAAVVDEFTPTVLGTAYGLCGDWHLAGDIAQEAFATLVTRIGDVREPAAFPGWLMAVVRTAARRQRVTVAVAPALDQVVAGPEDEVVARDDARRVRLAVEALPSEQRLPMVLHYFAGCPLADIAELCDLPLSTVKKRMRVARARLREEMDDMTTMIRPDAADDPSDVIRKYTAMRSGDLARVASILDVRPDLVDVRESWTRAESFAHRLPWTKGGGTPLLRAVERGDVDMVRLLLTRGADPNGACTCEGGESPLWVAVLQRETEIVDVLLDAGADPNPVAFGGHSAKDVARMRGYDALADRLARASDAVGTGIKALDLWCPLPERGLVSLTPGFGLGAFVLIGELCHRAAARGRRVVWTGFVQAPTDLGDVHHGLGETGIGDLVELAMAAPTASAEEQLAAFDRGIRIAGDDAFTVVFAETGHNHLVEERLPALAARDAVTLVVGPLDGSAVPPKLAGSPYIASIEFDVERAVRGQWPAISSTSWSKLADAELIELAKVVDDAALHDYLCQPFFVAEPFLAPGQSIPLDDLRAGIAALPRRQPNE